MDNEAFPNHKRSDEILKDAIDFLDTAQYSFAQFVSAFKRYLEKSTKENSQ